jgi:hypothetical protein
LGRFANRNIWENNEYRTNAQQLFACDSAGARHWHVLRNRRERADNTNSDRTAPRGQETHHHGILVGDRSVDYSEEFG